MSKSTITPDFFIVGAPRCGTTAMSSYLSSHRSICFSVPKEPHYFSADMPAMQYVTNEADYLNKCFGHWSGGECLAVGEGSVWYLYSRIAIANILEYRADARFIIMVRNPLDMVPSFHRKAFESLDEEVADFSTAWNLQNRRRAGRDLPRTCRDPRLLQYSSVGMLGRQVRRAFQQIPDHQRHVIVYDDLLDEPVETYKSVLTFLGVPYDGRAEFPRVSENQRVRNRRLLELAWNPPAMLMRGVELGKRLLGVERLAVLPRLRERLLVPEARPPLSDEMRRVMVDEFSPDIDLLSELLDRDLSHWKQVRCAGAEEN